MLDALAINFDLPILDWIQANLQSGFMDFLMPIITKFGDGGVFWILVALILLITPKYRKTGLAMAIGLVMGVVICNIILKPLVGRPRPYDFQMTEYGREILLLVKRQSDFSFPSGHTIASFEACVPMLINDKKLGIPATILAVLVAFSRLYLYLHYPTDVLFSLVIGTLFGIIGTILAPKILNRIPNQNGKYLRQE